MSETSETGTSETVADLRALVAELTARIESLEVRAAQWHPEVSEDVLLAIAAACAAYLGERATVKQVHLRRGGTWASQGRAAAQQSHADLHAYGERQQGTPPPRTPRGQAQRGTT